MAEITNADLIDILHEVQNSSALCLPSYPFPTVQEAMQLFCQSINPSYANPRHLLNISFAFPFNFIVHFSPFFKFCLTPWQNLPLNQPWHLCLSIQFLFLNVFSAVIQPFVYVLMIVEDLAITSRKKARLLPLLPAKAFNSFSATLSACHRV